MSAASPTSSYSSSSLPKVGKSPLGICSTLESRDGARTEGALRDGAREPACDGAREPAWDLATGGNESHLLLSNGGPSSVMKLSLTGLAPPLLSIPSR